MPRLPGIEKVTRASNDGLRLPALRAPKVDPTGAALQDFGQSLGKFGEAMDEFNKKRKALKAAESRIEQDEFDSGLFRDRAKGDETEGEVPFNPDGSPPP